MSLIPALLRGMAHYRYERDRLNRGGHDPYGEGVEEDLHFGPELDLGDAGGEIIRSFQKLGVQEGLPSAPQLRVPKPQYPQYSPE